MSSELQQEEEWASVCYMTEIAHCEQRDRELFKDRVQSNTLCQVSVGMLGQKNTLTFLEFKLTGICQRACCQSEQAHVKNKMLEKQGDLPSGYEESNEGRFPKPACPDTGTS